MTDETRPQPTPLPPEDHEDDARAWDERDHGWQIGQDRYERWLASTWERP